MTWVTEYSYTNIKCPICKHLSYSYEECREEYITVEQHGHCDKCGYCLEMAYSPTYEFFIDIKHGYKDYNGNYHKKNKKRHMRIRRKYADEEIVKQIMRDNPYGKNQI